MQNEHPSKKVKVWFEDESRYGQQGIVPRIWATRGSSPSLPKQNGYKNAWLFEAVCPQTGEHLGFVATHTNTDFMNIFLENLSKSLDSDVHGVLIMDNASWHKSADLKVPSNLSLKYQPPYCPELNPVERLWKYIKSKHLSHKFYVSLEEIFEEGCNSFKKLTKENVKTLCKVNYLNF